MEKPQPEKLELSRTEPSDLKIYFMISRPIKLELTNEKVIAILAYDIESALVKAKVIAQGLEVVYYGQALPVRELINKLYLDNVIVPPPAEPSKTIEPEKEIEKLSIQQFKAGLLMVLNDFLKVETDRKKLKEIIKKIK